MRDMPSKMSHLKTPLEHHGPLQCLCRDGTTATDALQCHLKRLIAHVPAFSFFFIVFKSTIFSLCFVGFLFGFVLVFFPETPADYLKDTSEQMRRWVLSLSSRLPEMPWESKHVSTLAIGTAQPGCLPVYWQFCGYRGFLKWFSIC